MMSIEENSTQPLFGSGESTSSLWSGFCSTSDGRCYVAREKFDLWTVVQHSAFGYKGDPQFRWGLETRPITTKGDKRRVERAGGLLFKGYMMAEDCAEEAMYPDEGMGLIPQANRVGTFSVHVIDGLRIFVPTEEFRRSFMNEQEGVT